MKCLKGIVERDFKNWKQGCYPEQKIYKKIKKIFSSHLFLAVIINLFFLLLILFFCDMKYEVSDDFIMASIMSGAYGNEPNPQMIFVNVILGYLLLPLYQLVPSISWYFVMEIVLVFLSSTTVTYLLFEKMDKSKAFMLSIILILFFANDAYLLGSVYEDCNVCCDGRRNVIHMGAFRKEKCMEHFVWGLTLFDRNNGTVFNNLSCRRFFSIYFNI